LIELREQAILQQNIHQANQQASARTTPQQLAAMKRKAQMDTIRKIDGDLYDTTTLLYRDFMSSFL